MNPLFTGELYLPNDAALMKRQMHFQDLAAAYNQTLPSQQTQRAELLPTLFAEVGPNCYVEAPFYANWGGHHVHLGTGVYANYHLTLVDDGEIFIGSHTMIGPNVTLATAGHPIAPSLRAQGYQYNLPIHIGENCWLGAGVTVLPGVTIGDNTVVGAGALVTRDLPSDVVAVGTPAKILRKISAHDHAFYTKNRRIDWDHLQ